MKTSEHQTERHWQNTMQTRHGESDNVLRKCTKCRHLAENADGAPACDQFITPGGYPMPWDADNWACGLFEEREGGTL